MGSDKPFSQAQHALIDPLVEPDPSEETGLNSHFGSTFASPPSSAGVKDFSSVDIRSQHTGSLIETNPYRRSGASSGANSASVRAGEMTPQRTSKKHDYAPSSYPSPPNSASPRREQFVDYRKDAFKTVGEGRPRRSSQPSSFADSAKESGLTRGGSLRERYPGDPSVRPLETIRKDTKTAYRTPHLRKKNFQGADIIDRLDKTTSSYHHEGPYDAANISRNLIWKNSPVAAVADSNEEALRATPRENIIDSISRHRPLEGTANLPPGIPDRFGRVLDYQEGTDLQRDPLNGGDYKRWPGVQYHPDDLKAKGEPSYTIEKALKEHKMYGDSGTELQSRRRNLSVGAHDTSPVPADTPEQDGGFRRSNSTGKTKGLGLKKRFGSLRRRKGAP